MDAVATIGVDLVIKETILENGIPVVVHLFDTAGTDKARNITANYFRASHGVIIVYDVMNNKSIIKIPKYIAKIH